MNSTEDSRVGFFGELRRRKVPRTVAAYIFICWGILQVAEILLPAVGVDADAALRMILYISIAGFPVCIALAWFFQITRNGIVLTSTFQERRVLNNIPPINERRRGNVGRYFNKEEDQAAYRWVLLMETGPLEGLSYAISRTTVIGRALDCDLTILSNVVSRNHARMDVQGDKLVLEDLGSANGTLVNGVRVETPITLHHDDEIHIQDICMKVTESYSRSSSENTAMSQTTVVEVAALQNPDKPKTGS